MGYVATMWCYYTYMRKALSFHTKVECVNTALCALRIATSHSLSTVLLLITYSIQNLRVRCTVSDEKMDGGKACASTFSEENKNTLTGW